MLGVRGPQAHDELSGHRGAWKVKYSSRKPKIKPRGRAWRQADLCEVMDHRYG